MEGIYEKYEDVSIWIHKLVKIYTNLKLIDICQIYQDYIEVLSNYERNIYDFSNFRYLNFIPHCKDCVDDIFCYCEISTEQKIIAFEELLKYEHNLNIHPIWNLWELDQIDYTNTIQWLPRELIEMNFEYYRGEYQVNPTTYIH